LVFWRRLDKSKTYVTLGLAASACGYLAIAVVFQSLNVTADWGFVRCFAGFFCGNLIFALSRKTALRFDGAAFKAAEVAIALGALAVMGVCAGRLYRRHHSSLHRFDLFAPV
jgi:hypothetical protein